VGVNADLRCARVNLPPLALCLLTRLQLGAADRDEEKMPVTEPAA
jgi:hypothetical protein